MRAYNALTCTFTFPNGLMCPSAAELGFSADLDWRIVIEPGEPTYFLPQFGGEPLESAALSTEALDQLAGGQRVLADLFPRVTQVA